MYKRQEAGRPDTITPEKLRVLKSAGVGRVSINPQSMNAVSYTHLDVYKRQTCTLVDYLRSKGAKCEYYIPNRLTDGYGLNRPAMEQLYEQGTRLLITVDSGITANEEIAVCLLYTSRCV